MQMRKTLGNCRGGVKLIGGGQKVDEVLVFYLSK